MLSAIRTRRSVRDFGTSSVTDQQLEAILDAGRWAPSGLNSQPWDFVVVKDPQTRSSMGDILSRITISWKGLAAASVMIVVSVDATRDPDHFIEDGATAAQNMCLAAQSLGLASSWAGVHAKRSRKGNVERALKQVVSLPRTHRIIAIVPIGRAEGEACVSSRIPLSEIVHHERYHPRQRYRSEQ